jgi:ABC-type oligopeptide transport system substrate-binding subunit
MKKFTWLVVALSILATNTACSSGPEYGLKTREGSFYCFTVPNFEFQNYEARLYDVNGELVSTENNLDVEESTDRYSTGMCELSASFRDIPLGNGPYKIEYLVDGDIVLDTWEFENFDLEY